MTIALGIDFEDIIHTPAYQSLSNTSEIDIDLERITDNMLRLFNEYDVSATFFVVSEIAEQSPGIVKRIANEGHEIASHTITHASLTNAPPEQCIEEIHESKSKLESITGSQISGFRAPTCQMNDRAYRQLSEAGYSYSSSVMPCLPIPGFYSNEYEFKSPTEIVTNTGTLSETPLSVNPSIRLPVSGAWIRLLGRRYLLRSVRSLIGQNTPVVTYSHPWEFTELQDTELPFRCRVRTGDWMHDTYDKLLQTDAEFCTMSELLETQSPANSYTAAK